MYLFDKIVTDLGLKRDPARGPLIDVHINFYGDNNLTPIDPDADFKDMGNSLVRSDIELTLIESET